MSSVLYRNPGSSYPQAIRGEGMYFVDDAERRFLDMSGGAAVSCLGHGHAGLIQAVKQQLDSLAFAHTAFFTNAPQEELSARLANRFPEPGAKAWFTSGGSESNETALKMAWQYWRAHGQTDKTVVISRQYSYHGGTLGATSISGSVFRREPYEKVLHNWPRIGPCYAYRNQREDETEQEYGYRAAAELAQAIEQTGADKVAAFIAEPVVGATLGVVPPASGYFQEIRRVCDAYDVLLIADEVMCGNGRTGTYYAFEQEEIIPDIVTIAKGLGGGYQPLGAVVTRACVSDGLEIDPAGFAHGHTYVGHATACAAGIAVQDALDDGLLAAVPDKGEQLLQRLQERFAEHPYIGDIRGRGLFAGIEIVADKETKAPFGVDARIPAKLKQSAMEHGVIMYPGGGSVDGQRGAHILLAPPYIAEAEHFEELLIKLDAIFQHVFS